MYDNPENIGPDEIKRKLQSLGYGPNRNERFKVLSEYSIQIISKEEWIQKWCFGAYKF